MIKKIACVIFLSLFLTNVCFAVNSSGFRLPNPTKFADLEAFFNNIPLVIQTFAGTIFIVMLLVGGIMYMTSGGNEQSTGKAKNMLLYSIVGIIVVALSIPAVNFIRGRVSKEPAPQSQPATSPRSSANPSPTSATVNIREYSVYPNEFTGQLPEKSVREAQVLPDNFTGPPRVGDIFKKQVRYYMNIKGEIEKDMNQDFENQGETDLYNVDSNSG